MLVPGSRSGVLLLQKLLQRSHLAGSWAVNACAQPCTLPAQAVVTATWSKVLADRCALLHCTRGLAAGSDAASTSQAQPASTPGPEPAEDQPDVPVTALVREFKARALYIGSEIDLYQLSEQEEVKRCKPALTNNRLTVCLSQKPQRREVVEADSRDTRGLPMDTYVAAFRYGAIVVFNSTSDYESQIVAICQRHTKNPHVHMSFIEEYRVTVQPNLPSWSRLDADHLWLQQLTWNNIKTIAHVLGQSVAMDAYAKKVDARLRMFTDMNTTMSKTGNFTAVSKEELLRLVADNNITLTDILTKLKIHDRFDIAWKYPQYEVIYDHLRRELEVDNRYRSWKQSLPVGVVQLNLVQDNFKYFLELLQNAKSESLEWTIIVLIGVEIVLGVYSTVVG